MSQFNIFESFQFQYIGQVESNLIQQLTATDMAPLSGVPLEILNAQQYV